jgi:cytochrome c oxidase subunit 2
METANMGRKAILQIALIIGLFGVYHIEAQDTVRTIVVHAHRFAFEPSSITVHRDETIRLQLISDDVPHSLVVKQLQINVEAAKAHQGETTFTAHQVGDFAGRCGRFCGSGHGQMQFTIHVAGD